ncbi:MAG: ATP-dependent DNA helicase RecG [Gammaproteobacteria bacterium]
MVTIDKSVTALKGVGPRVAERLAAIDIHTLQDILFHLPRRYEDRTQVTPIGSLRPGMQAVIDAAVELADIQFGRRRSLLVRVSDGTGAMTIRLFHFSKQQQAGFARGKRYRFFGEVRFGSHAFEMVHPEYQALDSVNVKLEDRLTPVYPATEGVGQLQLRRMARQVLEMLDQHGLPEWLPPALLSQWPFPELADAIRYVHCPPAGEDLLILEQGQHPAQQRLAFEELLSHHLSLRDVKQRAQENRAPPMQKNCPMCLQFLKSLPFSLTAAQERVNGEIATDLQQTYPMMRLVQGDVGSGKTVVAATAAVRVIAQGYQVAIMAPTELLAEQHLANFRSWLEPLGMTVGWLSGKSKGKLRAESLAALAEGSIEIIIGTHALFQDGVEFSQLGLVIIDEQHRFGVHQRLSLRNKGLQAGSEPHQLIMTATPIPRTLAMTFYADLDISVIDELPPGRSPVRTVAIAESRRDDVIQRVQQACQQGQQAYWVCPLIEQSDILQCQAAEEVAILLTGLLPDLKVALLHGRMKAQEKTTIMAEFKSAGIDLLVATTVIEVGVDVPNASLMIIENAERLGLAQLHQLRGRVGRGQAQSHCVLMYQPPLSKVARKRLHVMRSTNDGFEVAREDLALRGPGEVLGTRQTGEMQFRIADLLRDAEMLDQVETIADRLYAEFPEHIRPLIQRWLGSADRYSQV